MFFITPFKKNPIKPSVWVRFKKIGCANMGVFTWQSCDFRSAESFFPGVP